ncbi:MAG: hypothetical protein ABIP65_06460 [Vicinamibacterales bacterium]
MLRVLLAAAALVASISPANAQFVRRDTPRSGSVELSGGVLLQGGTDLPDFTATLTRNPTTGSSPLQLFKSDAKLGLAPGLQATVGVYVSRAVSLEAGVQVSRPELRVRLTDDVEDAPDVTATEAITSYVFTGSVLYHFGKPASRVRPFLMAGAGHVRDLHEGNDLIDTGLEYHAGGGLKWWRGKGRRKLGLRADVGVSVRAGGFGTDDGNRIVPTAAASLAYVY